MNLNCPRIAESISQPLILFWGRPKPLTRSQASLCSVWAEPHISFSLHVFWETNLRFTEKVQRQ